MQARPSDRAFRVTRIFRANEANEAFARTLKAHHFGILPGIPSKVAPDLISLANK